MSSMAWITQPLFRVFCIADIRCLTYTCLLANYVWYLVAGICSSPVSLLIGLRHWCLAKPMNITSKAITLNPAHPHTPTSSYSHGHHAHHAHSSYAMPSFLTSCWLLLSYAVEAVLKREQILATDWHITHTVANTLAITQLTLFDWGVNK